VHLTSKPKMAESNIGNIISNTQTKSVIKVNSYLQEQKRDSLSQNNHQQRKTSAVFASSIIVMFDLWKIWLDSLPEVEYLVSWNTRCCGRQKHFIYGRRQFSYQNCIGNWSQLYLPNEVQFTSILKGFWNYTTKHFQVKLIRHIHQHL